MIVLAVIIGLSLLIVVHELGHFLAAKAFHVRVDEFSFGFPPRIFSVRYGETKYSIGVFPLGGFVKIYGETQGDHNPDAPDAARSFLSQPIFNRSVIMLAGVFMNVFLAGLIISGVFMMGSPKLAVISEVAPFSPAAEAGIMNGDVVLRISAGNAVLSDIATPDPFVAFVKQNIKTVLTIQIERNGKPLAITLRGREKPPEGEGALGVSLTGVGFDREQFFTAIVHGFQTTLDILVQVTLGFINFFKNIFVKPEILKTMAGPVGIFTLAANAGSLGLAYLFQLIAIISINLAVLNFIPFPALDGGRFLFLLIEGVKGSAIPERVERIINTVGFAALILLMILVTIQDIGRLL
ncbi:MAG: RIP metalloprotease RseP [Candidatus Jorgensenbacteria bacterium]|nr:RIP metalloprotease RseP [Candidatus Jorgensenbacteria bacterium]